MVYRLNAVGVVRSPYGEKFSVPRQSGLAPDVCSQLEFFPPYSDPAAFAGLEGFSHIYILFIFDRTPDRVFRAKVRPPRLGGNKRVGVFASRSPCRPSRLGLSVVRLLAIKVKAGRTVLEVSGADLVDGTPIIDIKPYIPFVDCIRDASGGFASEPPPRFEVEFTPAALKVLSGLGEQQLLAIREILSQDPRPAYRGQSEDHHGYGALLYGYNLRFYCEESRLIVTDAARVEVCRGTSGTGACSDAKAARAGQEDAGAEVCREAAGTGVCEEVTGAGASREHSEPLPAGKEPGPVPEP